MIPFSACDLRASGCASHEPEHSLVDDPSRHGGLDARSDGRGRFDRAIVQVGGTDLIH